MTNDEADRKLLGLANEKHKFALEIGHLDVDMQFALERGIDNEWFTLVDVSRLAARPGVFRIFRLTDAGVRRLADLPDPAHREPVGQHHDEQECSERGDDERDRAQVSPRDGH